MVVFSTVVSVVVVYMLEGSNLPYSVKALRSCRLHGFVCH